MSWYLKKNDGSLYGPVEKTVLLEWAHEGRIAPDDNLSEDKKSWIDATSLPDLKMDWIIEFPDGTRYGPLCLPALRDLVADGSVSLTVTVRNRKSGQTQTLDAAFRAMGLMPKPSPASSTGSVPPTSRQEWRELTANRDSFEKEAQKWKNLYEDERQKNVRHEGELNTRLEEMRRNDLASRTQIEQLEHKLTQLEKNYTLLKQRSETSPAGDAASQWTSLMTVFNELSQRYDILMNQLAEKSSEINALVESRAQAEKNAEDQVRKMQETVQRERDEADRARKRAADIESTHFELVKSYRELNDRFFHLRDQHGGGHPGTVIKRAPPPASGKK